MLISNCHYLVHIRENFVNVYKLYIHIVKLLFQLNANQLRGFSNTEEFKNACNSENHRTPCFKALIRYYGSSSKLHVNFHITTKKKGKIKFDDLYHPRSPGKYL